MDYNYHTHTFRCNHATGTEEEYIERAINGGIKFMGFSDHAPYVFPDGYETSYRVPMNKAEDYVATISALREKYKDKIDIKIGFEMEYYASHFDKMLENVSKLGTEYLILGQHFLYEEHPNGISSSQGESLEELKEYVSCVVNGIKTGYFTYVAHPDLIRFGGTAEQYKREMRKICVASREYDIPLEINFLGIREEKSYPDRVFWSVAGEEKCPVTFGFDAHDVMNAYDGESLKTAEKIVKEYELNYIGMPKIIDIRKK